jgi:hypothetical protein
MDRVFASLIENLSRNEMQIGFVVDAVGFVGHPAEFRRVAEMRGLR